jgi:N-acetylmuramic acid 6-phosphate etherase
MISTETVDPRFESIDIWSTSDAVEAMLEGQMAAIAAIKNQTGTIAAASEAAAQRLLRGGRLVYVGAGTSGRIAVQDGVELGPTYGWPSDRMVFVIAGGLRALSESAEGAEDDGASSRAVLAQHSLSADDVVIGVAASGRTPFTVSAIDAARTAGALTIGIANNADAPLLTSSAFAICANTGSELVAGSTRMKAGTAQKAVLNLLSTAIMIRLGRVYRGLMINMVISNDKLLGRANAIVKHIAGCDDRTAIEAVETADRDIACAILIAKGLSLDEAVDLLAKHHHVLREAIGAMGERVR